MERLLTTREVAEMLSVGPTSVKRWADMGLLPHVKTAGGHRRFQERAVRAFTASLPAEEGAEAKQSNLPEWIDLLVHADDGHAVEAALAQERSRRGSWWKVAETVGDIIKELGRLWEEKELTILQEHMASEKLHRALGRVSHGIPTAPSSPVCLLIGTDADEHTLGLSLAELCAREAGWRTSWAGRRTPIEDVIELVESGGAQMVAVSASSFSSDRLTLRRMAQQIGKACSGNNAILVLGGSGAWPDKPKYGQRIQSFEDFYDVLVANRAK